LEGREVVFPTSPQPSLKERELDPADCKYASDLEAIALPNYKNSLNRILQEPSFGGQGGCILPHPNPLQRRGSLALLT